MARQRGTLAGPIISAATSLFLKDGYAGTHMARVAEEADVSLATLYRYFESKEHLLDQAFRREVERIEQPLWGGWSPQDADLLAPYASLVYRHTLAWATSNAALGLLITMAESPGLLYRFFLDRVEVYEYGMHHTIGRLMDETDWIPMHSVVAASGFYAMMIRWGRARLPMARPDHPRTVPDQLPDSARDRHVPGTCDFTAPELAEWYTIMRLRSFGISEDEIHDAVATARSDGWQLEPTGAPG